MPETPKKTVYYADYLGLNQILNAQHPVSQFHDERLFIVVHQVYELWFKQILCELDLGCSFLASGNLDDRDLIKVHRCLTRMIEIQKVLNDQIRIMETMTPMDFLEFRDLLSPSSGFQSFQFRILENKLGLRTRSQLDHQPYWNRLSEEDQKRVKASEREPNLFELLDQWLARTPFLDDPSFPFWEEYQSAIQKMFHQDQSMIESNPHLSGDDKKKQLEKQTQLKDQFDILLNEARYSELLKTNQRRLSHRAVQAALMIFLYREQPVFQIPFKLLESLIDLDELMTQWRYRHALMAYRMIGKKIGTGGSSGYDYLAEAAAKHKVFDELTNLSSYLIPRSNLPALPPTLSEKLGFQYHRFSKGV